MRTAPGLPGLVALAAVGGALGGTARALVAQALPAGYGLPVGTLGVNLLGCLLLGLLVARRPDDVALRAFAGTGLLGGFTTFSALALETDRLLVQAPALALAYLAASTAGGLALAALGLRLGARR